MVLAVHSMSWIILYKTITHVRQDSDANWMVAFFFYWRYYPLWILALSVILFHYVLILHNFLHPLYIVFNVLNPSFPYIIFSTLLFPSSVYLLQRPQSICSLVFLWFSCMDQCSPAYWCPLQYTWSPRMAKLNEWIKRGIHFFDCCLLWTWQKKLLSWLFFINLQSGSILFMTGEACAASLRTTKTFNRPCSHVLW